MTSLRNQPDYGKWITREKMKEICPTCANKMKSKGLSCVKSSFLTREQRIAGKIAGI